MRGPNGIDKGWLWFSLLLLIPIFGLDMIWLSVIGDMLSAPNDIKVIVGIALIALFKNVE